VRKPFSHLESEVRSYSRSFPAVFHRAIGPYLFAEDGRRYIDFLAGAGALNYGHNHPDIRQRLIDYLEAEGVVHMLDLHTTPLREFLETLEDLILNPGQLPFRVQFCGPTGTNAIEAAIKLARKVTGRSGIFSFSGGYHGVTAGSLAVTADAHRRRLAHSPPDSVTFFPYAVGPYSDWDSVDYMEDVLRDPMSGVARPAAVILEPVQAEGGVFVAPIGWLRRLRELCSRHQILLVCDEIQTGCGRTGPFFAFQRAGICPDLVTVAKSISGYGLPLSLLLFRSEFDRWAPGEHNGTFRANQLALVGGTAALRLRSTLGLEKTVATHERWLAENLPGAAQAIHPDIVVRGVGLIWGVDLDQCGGEELARDVSRRCFANGLIIERVGRNDTVLKLLPPLLISSDVLEEGCKILLSAIAESVFVSNGAPARRLHS
jgi:diaminobutyrate-2-oxoglutarate transaminase